MLIKKIFFVFLLLNSSLLAVKIIRTQVIMGTFCTIKLEKIDKIQDGFIYLKNLEKILSSYDRDADIYHLNKKKSIFANPYIKEILELSKMYHKRTNGYFDISIGSITKELYHFGEDEQIPNKKEIQDAVIGMDKIFIQKESIKIDEDITIDLGGIAKGYSVDKLSYYYQNQGIKKGEIVLSGDIRCFDKCEILIESPFDEKPFVLLHSKIDNFSISTSGTYRRFVKNKKNHHLFNPKTKLQGRDFSSVTILSHKNNTLCDTYATAVSVMPSKAALEFLDKESKIGYILITAKGKVIYGNLDKFVKVKWLKNIEAERN